MCKEGIFQEVLNKVTEVTGIDSNEVKSSKMEYATDARYILIKALVRLGFSNWDISVFLGCSRQAVGYMYNHYKRTKWTLENDLKCVLNWVENEYLK